MAGHAGRSSTGDRPGGERHSRPRASGRCSKRAIANFAAPGLDYLVRIVKRKLKKLQYRPHLIDGCLAATGLRIEPW